MVPCGLSACLIIFCSLFWTDGFQLRRAGLQGFLEFVLGLTQTLVQTSGLVRVSRKHKFMEQVYSRVYLKTAVEYVEQLNWSVFTVCLVYFLLKPTWTDHTVDFFSDSFYVLFPFSCFLPVLHFLSSHFLVTSVKVLIKPFVLFCPVSSQLIPSCLCNIFNDITGVFTISWRGLTIKVSIGMFVRYTQLLHFLCPSSPK